MGGLGGSRRWSPQANVEPTITSCQFMNTDSIRSSVGKAGAPELTHHHRSPL
jgi:hypothetical protein